MKVKTSDIEKALKEYGGLISPVAARFHVTRQAIYNRIRSNKRLQQIKDEAEESMLDVAESMLISNIKEKKEASIFFYLKTKGKNRGYIERQEVTGADNKPLYPTEQIDYSKLDESILRAISKAGKSS